MFGLNLGDYQVQVRMPASFVMLKLRAFVMDQGGTIVEDLAPREGVLHARLRPGGKSVPWASPGTDSWSGVDAGTKAAPSGLELDVELRVQADPKQPDNHTIALKLRIVRNTGAASPKQIREQFEKLIDDLKAYLHVNATCVGDYWEK